MMTEQKKFFADRWLTHFNGNKAAIEAGYSEKTARVQASQILAEDEVSLYIQDRMAAISKEAEVDSVWVLKRFKEISDRCMQEKPVMVRDGSTWKESGEYEFDSNGANKATENIGKHIGFYKKDNEQSKPDTNLILTKESIKEISDKLDADY